MRNLVTQSVFSKTNPEYLANGIYEYHGTIYATVWSYKRHMQLNDNNATKNAEDAQSIPHSVRCIHVQPNFGNHDIALAFDVRGLDAKYSREFIWR